MATRKVLSALGRIATVALIAVIFALGLAGTVYLSLRSPETQVPDVVSKSYQDGESILEKSGLGIRERAKRFKPDVQPGVILDQSPRSGEVVKTGQTVAVVVSRAAKEGEKGFSEPAEVKREAGPAPKSANEENSSAPKNENQNRERRASRNANRNANANTNANGNRNTNNQSANNSNRNAGANANAGNRNANANRNPDANANANRNRNANSRNANANTNAGAGRNANTGRPTSNNANRRPPAP